MNVAANAGRSRAAHGRRAGACCVIGADGLVPHLWPSANPRTDREQNQVTVIGSGKGTNTVAVGFTA
jgi:hypothetical protein